MFRPVRTASAAVLLAAATLVVTLAAPAHATYPGTNGRIAYSQWEEPDVALMTAEPDGEDRTAIADGAAFHDSSWSPDGRWIVAAGGNSPFNARKVVLMRADGSDRRTVITVDNEVSAPSFSASGQRLLYTDWQGGGARVFSIRRDGSEKRRIAGDLDGSVMHAVASPNGNRYAFSFRPRGKEWSALFTMRTDGGGLRRLSPREGFVEQPDWSPDGTRLLYTWMRPDFSKQHVMRVDRDGTHRRQLTSNSGYSENPAWSPDGRRIVYQHHDQTDTIRMMRADGSDDHRWLSTTGLLDPSWQPR
jgi:Tol biopolymer transport system component